MGYNSYLARVWFYGEKGRFYCLATNFHASAACVFLCFYMKLFKCLPRRQRLLRSSKYQGQILLKHKQPIPVTMKPDNVIVNIDEEENLNHATAEQLAKIVEFLLNLED